MDISFRVENEKFNYRVGAIIISDGKILVMHDERSPFYYLPGGRVKLGERAEDAILREMREELSIEPEIVRPLWLSQGFFTEDVDQLKYHEIGIYFLVDASKTEIMSFGKSFITKEGSKNLTFEWLEFERLEQEYFYPLFLKKEIFNLPSELTIITEYQ